MGSAIDKDQFRNPKKHQVGAVIIDAANKAKGVVVPPGGTIWLSEDEQRLTANAPRKDEDNPFVRGHLVPTNANRPIGNERPTRADAPHDPQVEAAPPAEQPPVEPPPPAPPVEEQAPVPPEPVPVPPVVDHTKHLEELEAERSQGEGDPVAPAPASDLDEETAQEAAQTTPGGPEEEEIGAAVPPAGDPPQGEYQAQEEVGTPEAPAAQPPADQPTPPADGPLKMQE